MFICQFFLQIFRHESESLPINVAAAACLQNVIKNSFVFRTSANHDNNDDTVNDNNDNDNDDIDDIDDDDDDDDDRRL